jgi:Lar family restriction alleviation protein
MSLFERITDDQPGLQACPFCGHAAEAAESRESTPGSERIIVCCASCGARTKDVSATVGRKQAVRDAAALWNQRAGAPSGPSLSRRRR